MNIAHLLLVLVGGEGCGQATLLCTPGLQPATIHPTRSFAILQAAEYDAVVSITHVGQPYLFTVQAPRDARPDAAANQAAHDVLTSLYPAAKSSLDQLLATELSAIPNSQHKRDGIRVGATVAQLLEDALLPVSKRLGCRP